MDGHTVVGQEGWHAACVRIVPGGVGQAETVLAGGQAGEAWARGGWSGATKRSLQGSSGGFGDCV